MIIYCRQAFSCTVQITGTKLMLSRGCSFSVYLWSRRCMRKSRPAVPVKSEFPQSTSFESPGAVCGLSEVPILTFLHNRIELIYASACLDNKIGFWQCHAIINKESLKLRTIFRACLILTTFDST